MLVIENLTKRYGNFYALNGLNLTIDTGSIFGFVGPNGAGKTTTMKIVSGLISKTSGKVYINDEIQTDKSDNLKNKIGYMPDFFGVYDNLKVDEYMDFYAGTYYIPYSERKAIIDNLLDIVDLAHKKDSYVDNLSRGMKQRLCLARSMVHDPDILILDEPASGLDPRARVEMKEILKQLKTLGKTIIISSHILPELAEMCTTVGIINEGKLVANGTIAEIMRNMQGSKIISAKCIENIDNFVSLLSEKPEVENLIQKVDEVEFDFNGDERKMAEILKEAFSKDILISEIKEREGNLEDIFIKLTDKEDEEIA